MTDAELEPPGDPRQVRLLEIARSASFGTATVLRGCPRCGAAHPLACMPPHADATRCWSCGHALAEPEVLDLNTSFNMPWWACWLVGLCEACANFLNRLARRIQP